MRNYIRKVKSKSGATAVQIEHKRGRERIGITHIGSAHNEAELKVLLEIAHKKMHEGQLNFDFGARTDPDICLERSYSGLLWDTLESVYKELGFEGVSDSVFKQLVLARIIEPVSKLDTIRVLEGLGLDAPSNTSIHRCLRRVAGAGYRDTVSRACFRRTALSTLSLVLYDM